MKKIAFVFLVVMFALCCALACAESEFAFLDNMTLDELEKLQVAVEQKIGELSDTTIPTEPPTLEITEMAQYISDREFFYHSGDDMYYIRFAFKDKDKNKIACPCTVSARLVNSEGNVVYSTTKELSMANDFWTWTWNNDQYSYRNGIYATIPISRDEIATSSNAKGTMYISVTLENGSGWSEEAIAVEDLPLKETTLSVETAIPQYITYNNAVVCVTSVSYNVEEKYDGTVTVHVFMDGECTSGIRKAVRMRWTLSDNDGYTIDSGIWTFDTLSVGDKFRDKEFVIRFLKPGTYILDFENY